MMSDPELSDIHIDFSNAIESLHTEIGSQVVNAISAKQHNFNTITKILVHCDTALQNTFHYECNNDKQVEQKSISEDPKRARNC